MSGYICLEAAAAGLARVRPFAPVSGPFSGALNTGRNEKCGFDLIPTIVRMGAEESSLAATLRKLLKTEPAPSAEVILALVAVDPGSDDSIEVFSRRLFSPRTEIQIEANAGLSAAGPTAVLGNQTRLNVLLESGNQEVWRPIEDALAIAETEAAACKKTWAPPVPEPSPTPVPPPGPHGVSGGARRHPGDLKNPG